MISKIIYVVKTIWGTHLNKLILIVLLRIFAELTEVSESILREINSLEENNQQINPSWFSVLRILVQVFFDSGKKEAIFVLVLIFIVLAILKALEIKRTGSNQVKAPIKSGVDLPTGTQIKDLDYVHKSLNSHGQLSEQYITPIVQYLFEHPDFHSFGKVPNAQTIFLLHRSRVILETIKVHFSPQIRKYITAGINNISDLIDNNLNIQLSQGKSFSRVLTTHDITRVDSLLKLLVQYDYQSEKVIISQVDSLKFEFLANMTKAGLCLIDIYDLPSSIKSDSPEFEESTDLELTLFVSLSQNLTDQREYLVNQIKRSFGLNCKIYPDTSIIDINRLREDSYLKDNEDYITQCIRLSDCHVFVLNSNGFSSVEEMQLDIAHQIFTKERHPRLILCNVIGNSWSNSIAEVREFLPGLIKNCWIKKNINISKFKDLLFEKIEILNLENVQRSITKKQVGKPKYVYVTHGIKEPELLKNEKIQYVRDELGQRGITVTFSGNDFEEDTEIELILNSDGVILYHGDETDEPCTKKQLNIRKYLAHAENQHFYPKALFIDEPKHKLKKEKFKATDYLVLNSSQDMLQNELDEFYKILINE